jgi:N-acetylglucosamine-6-phosphate deacetylase
MEFLYMITQAIFADRAFTPHEAITDAVIVVEGSKIAAVGTRPCITVPDDAQRWETRGLTIVPGFVDMHIHGAGGHDVMEATPEALAAITETVAGHGTTSIVATTVTASEAATVRSIKEVESWMRAESSHASSATTSATTASVRAEILGVHLEGPFISPARRGVHPLQWITAPSLELLGRFLAAGDNTVRILTLAPEVPGAIELIEVARMRGLLVSLGHTDATYQQAILAIESGVRHAAHVYNAMRPFGHRDSGVIGAVLTMPSVSAELIADGVHVDEAAMRILLAAKGPRGVVLVSDGTAATGMPDGIYRLGTFEVKVTDGICRSAEGKLSGSTLTLDRAFRNMIALGVGFTDALAMLTENPARALGLEGRKGSLVAGADADLVLLDAENKVAGVMTRGTKWTAPVTNAKGH